MGYRFYLLTILLLLVDFSAVVACPSVCSSFCPSDTSRYCIETTGRIELVSAWELFWPVPNLRKIGHTFKNKGISLGNFAANSGLGKFRRGKSMLWSTLNNTRRRSSLCITPTTVERVVAECMKSANARWLTLFSHYFNFFWIYCTSSFYAGMQQLARFLLTHHVARSVCGSRPSGKSRRGKCFRGDYLMRHRLLNYRSRLPSKALLLWLKVQKKSRLGSWQLVDKAAVSPREAGVPRTLILIEFHAAFRRALKIHLLTLLLALKSAHWHFVLHSRHVFMYD